MTKAILTAAIVALAVIAVDAAQLRCCQKTTETGYADNVGGIVINDWTSPGAARNQDPVDYNATFGWPAAVGAFTFASPYNTLAYRLTQASDCTSNGDCVRQTGYSNLNMMSSCGLQQGSGCGDVIGGFLILAGQGPRKWTVTLSTGVRTLEPIFEAGDVNAGVSGVGDIWSMSLSEPWMLNAIDRNGGKIYRCDISDVSPALDTETDCELLWDIQTADNRTAMAAAFGGSAAGYTNAQAWSTYFDRSGDSFTFYVQDESECGGICGGVFVIAGDEVYYANDSVGDTGIDLSGRYGWWAAQHAPCASLPGGAAGDDQFTRDFVTNTTTVGCDQDGWVGHQGAGYGYILQEDNWAPEGQELLMIDLANIPAQGNDSGPTVFYNVEFGNSYVQPSFLTGQSTGVRALNQQQICTITTTDPVETWALEREIVCFYPGAAGALVVAPSMADMTATGSGGLEGDFDYYKAPKPPMSSDGRWILVGSNQGGSRLDLFLVRIPRANIPAAAPPSPLLRLAQALFPNPLRFK